MQSQSAAHWKEWKKQSPLQSTFLLPKCHSKTFFFLFSLKSPFLWFCWKFQSWPGWGVLQFCILMFIYFAPGLNPPSKAPLCQWQLHYPVSCNPHLEALHRAMTTWWPNVQKCTYSMCDRSEYLIPTLQLFQHMKHSPLQWQQTPSCCWFSTSLSIFHTLAHWLPGSTDIPALTCCFHMQRAS